MLIYGKDDFKVIVHIGLVRQIDVNRQERTIIFRYDANHYLTVNDASDAQMEHITSGAYLHDDTPVMI